MKTSELTGAALDWAVAKCQDWATKVNYGLIEFQGDLTHYAGAYCNPSGDWAQGGPIIERECIQIGCIHTTGWTPNSWDARHPQRVFAKGPTPLIAAMRCYVASKLGDEIDVPDELMENTK